ncbi:hypothetical protein T12_8756 [Trichinella patagoniensis]|uniref:Uncharacterized protein n=1 Tax=Trichinella patagoniensis TaxID=990121 RepID=A0A0V1A9R2_9BILA|nr:hypothetical protein T12_8756 [Trichinella patagoniensis]
MEHSDSASQFIAIPECTENGRPKTARRFKSRQEKHKSCYLSSSIALMPLHQSVVKMTIFHQKQYDSLISCNYKTHKAKTTKRIPQGKCNTFDRTANLQKCQLYKRNNAILHEDYNPILPCSIIFVSASQVTKAIAIWNVQRQTKAYMVNRRPLKFVGAYLNTQESEPFVTP